MACSLHVDKEKLYDCTCANTNFSQAVERVRKAFHSTHWPGSYGDHTACCSVFDLVLDRIRREERNPNFFEEDPFQSRYGRAPIL